MPAWAFGILMGINAGGVVAIGILSDIFQRHFLLAAVYLVRGVAFTTLVILPAKLPCGHSLSSVAHHGSQLFH